MSDFWKLEGRDFMDGNNIGKCPVAHGTTSMGMRGTSTRTTATHTHEADALTGADPHG